MTSDHFGNAECEIDGRSLHLCETLLAVKRKLSALERGRLKVVLNDEKARDDVLRFARDAGFRAEPLGQQGENFLLGVEKRKPEEKEQLEEVAVAERTRDSVLLVSNETIGASDQPLGRMVMNKFLYSLTETEERPTAIVIVSDGVRLATRESESIEAFRALEGAGVDVMVCRASSEFLTLRDKIAVGRLCDMYEIVEKLLAAGKTLSI